MKIEPEGVWLTCANLSTYRGKVSYPLSDSLSNSGYSVAMPQFTPKESAGCAAFKDKMNLHSEASDKLWSPQGPNLIVGGDNLPALRQLPSSSFPLIYIDPPFNTGKVQERQSYRSIKAAKGERLGFKGQNYKFIREKVTSYNDKFEDYWAFLEPRLEEAWRVLTENGSLYLHLDYREVHYAKVLLDSLFGRECFMNEIIWAYDYGARSKAKWPTKHDNILWYVKDPHNYIFNTESVDREPYMAPGLVTPEKAAKGKLPTDVWWHTIVSPTGKEKTGYATQKPIGVLRRIIQASSRPGDWVLDFFAGSGSTGAAAAECNRRFILIDNNPEAIDVMLARLGNPSLMGEVLVKEVS